MSLAIQGFVDQALEAVNALAESLKENVQKALDLLGRGLDAALGLLERGLHAIVDGVAAVVDGAISFAKGVVEALGAFAVLIKDIAGDPGGWLGKLGGAVMDGIQNHLWGALKTAALAWFQSKVLELLGIGGIVVQLLMEGGIDLGQISNMAWEALQTAIPAALIAILIEKLVSMIVPAAGPLFANLLAAAAVVVLDFVANWLLRKLASAARKVGAKLKNLAEKFKNRRSRGRGRGRDRRDRDRDRRDRNRNRHRDRDRDPRQKARGKDRKDRRDERSEKDRKNQQKLRKARKAIRKALRKATPEPRARALIHQIAGQHGVRASMTSDKRGLRLTLKVNPSLSDYFEKGEELSAAKQALKELKVTSHSASLALGRAITRLRQETGQGGTKHQDTKRVLEQAGGLEAFIKSRGSEIHSRSGKGPNKGHEREDRLNAALSANASDRAKAEKALAKSNAALAILRQVINGAGGKLRVVLAPPPQEEPTTERGIDAFERQKAQAIQLLEAGRRRGSPTGRSLYWPGWVTSSRWWNGSCFASSLRRPRPWQRQRAWPLLARSSTAAAARRRRREPRPCSRSLRSACWTMIRSL